VVVDGCMCAVKWTSKFVYVCLGGVMNRCVQYVCMERWMAGYVCVSVCVFVCVLT
jgi:hypothetical protein